MARVVLAGAVGAALALCATAIAVFAVPAAHGSSSHTRFVIFEQFKGGVGTEVVWKKQPKVVYVPGNYAVFRSPLRDGGPTGARIGINEATCLHNFTHDMCRGTFTINGRGTIGCDGLAPLTASGRPHDFAIVGGTGEFLGARGLCRVLAVSDKGFTWEITLID